jgi:hypothetical protein
MVMAPIRPASMSPLTVGIGGTLDPTSALQQFVRYPRYSGSSRSDPCTAAFDPYVQE